MNLPSEIIVAESSCLNSLASSMLSCVNDCQNVIESQVIVFSKLNHLTINVNSCKIFQNLPIFQV